MGLLPEPSKQYSITADSQNCFRACVCLSGAKEAPFIKRNGGRAYGIFSFFRSPPPLIYHTKLSYRTRDQKAQPGRKFIGITTFLFLKCSLLFFFSLKQSLLHGLTPFCTGCDQKAMQSARDPRASSKLHCLPSLRRCSMKNVVTQLHLNSSYTCGKHTSI